MAREAEFLLCLPSYRAAGGGGFLPERPIRQLSTGVSLQSAIVRWLSDHDLADAQFEPPWQLERSLGLSAVYDTHPDAEAHWDDIAEFAPEPVGRTADGYLRLRVQL
ncbi:MAG: hypothetical protein HRU30_01450 [Rhodobacteraceae bacterium]|nr:hypothetical protein [Paracoccaceae bacterium]